MTPPRTTRRPAQTRLAALAIALIVATLGFLPIVNWIPGGHEAPWYATELNYWLAGTLVVMGVGVVAAIFSRHFTFLWRNYSLSRIGALYERAPGAFAIVLAGGALALYVAVALSVFNTRPLLIDELVQAVQARIFADGALWRPAAPHPEFFGILHIVDTAGRYYSQFPPGGPAMLALGALVNATWLVGPVCGAVSVALFVACLRVIEPRPGVALAAALLFAFAPFTMFMSASYMNHTTALMWLLVAIASLVRVARVPAPRPALALVSGIGLACAATIRPVDALAFALPAGAWYLVRALRDRARWQDAIAAGIGVALPLAAMMWVNYHTTGGALRFGYEVLWGKNQALGFHSAPWGDVHTPARGLELVNIYLLRLQVYLFESPVPSLIPVIAALALARKFDAYDRYLLVSSALLLGLYFAYYHDGFYPGPRFVFPLAPVLALWTARFLPLLRERIGDGLPYRAAVYGGALAGALALATGIPHRAREYAGAFTTMRWNADSAAAAARVEHAVVLVRESWGAQLVARMWALGIPRSETELLYRSVDSCILERELSALERGPARGMAAYAALRPLLLDSARVVKSQLSPDPTERVLPGTHYSPRCVERIMEDRAGFTLLAPLLLARGGKNVYARDLHERDSLLLKQYPTQPLYLLRPTTYKEGAPPQFFAISRDSLVRTWRRAGQGN
jgi:hypothetical protein